MSLAGCALPLGLLPLCSTAAGLSCDPAVIDTVITNSPLCPGDQINLSVVASGDIQGYSWQGPGTGEYFTYTPLFTFTTQVLGAYVVVVYGECGNDTATVMIDAAGAGAGRDDTLHLCDNGPSWGMAPALGTHAEGGTWTFGDLSHNGVFDPAIDMPGAYVYTAPFAATCPGTSPTATITVELITVGPDSSTSTCALDSAFGLLQFLAPGVTPGGTWERHVFLAMEPHCDMYNPAVDSSGMFQYSIEGCAARVIVTEDPAWPWFLDADNDGLGDPLMVEWGCVQPAGHVADSTDLCTSLTGTIGDACDDGLPWTIDDAITDACACAGVNTTAILSREGRRPDFSIWPNPNTDGQLNIRAEGNGQAEIRVFDSLGRMHGRAHVRSIGGQDPVRMTLGSDLPQGVYFVQLTLDGRSSTAPLMVR